MELPFAPSEFSIPLKRVQLPQKVEVTDAMRAGSSVCVHRIANAFDGFTERLLAPIDQIQKKARGDARVEAGVGSLYEKVH